MTLILVMLIMISQLSLSNACAQELPVVPDSEQSRLEQAEKRIAELEEKIDKLAKPANPGKKEETSPDKSSKPANWESSYNQGFLIRPKDPAANPFEIKINGRMQFRHTSFTPDDKSWTDQTLTTREIVPRNDFEIERGRLMFEGYFIEPELQFFINIDSDTDDNHTLVFHDFWVSYEITESLEVFMGKAFIPGSRDWLNGAARMRMSDRSMATTFFRPDRTLGIWAIYEPIENLFYRVMIGNGYNTSDLRPDEIDNEFVYSASSWINLGDYGLGYSDLECHTTPVAQLGHSLTFAAAAGRDQLGNPLQEENSFRLSDGTRLTANGALAPGVTVDQLEVYMYSVDAAFKYLGCSFNSEYFFRWIDDLSGNGPLPITGYFEHGFYAEGGFFILPKKVELSARVSKIFGAYGDAEEYALGINYFIDSTHNWKFTIDACLLEHSPVNNTGINHRAGDDGLLIRSQLQAAF